MPQEVVPESGAVRSALNQARDVRQHDVLAVPPHDAQVRRQRREVVVPHLRLRARHRAQDGALAHVRVAHQAHVRDGLQFHSQRFDLRFDAGLGEVRRLPGRGGKVLVAPAALAALQQRAGFPGGVHIRHHAAGLVIPDHRAHRHLDHQVFAPLAGATVGASVPAVFRRVLAFEAEVQQRMHVLVGIELDVAAVAAVAAVRAAVHHILLPVEGGGSVSAVSGLRRDFYLINEIAHTLLISSSVSAAARESGRPGR